MSGMDGQWLQPEHDAHLKFTLAQKIEHGYIEFLSGVYMAAV
jgi:hypothetical protein